MTTYTFSGTAIYYDSFSGDITDIQDNAPKLTIVAPDSTKSFSYSHLGGGVGFFNPVDVTTNSYSEFLDGARLGSEITVDEAYVYRVSWKDGLNVTRWTTVLNLFVLDHSYPVGLRDAEYVFELGGTPLPPLNTESQLEAFQAKITGGAAPIWPFLPNVAIPFSNMSPAITQNDIITGTSGNDILDGGLGDDQIFGGNGGFDRLNGGVGDDILFAGAGTDRMDGGAGVDTVSYGYTHGTLIADLQFSNANSGWAKGDTYVGLENLFGNNANNNLRGNAGNNVLRGEGSNDILHGRAGNDTLDGGNGNDVLFGGAGADILRGGNGWDRAQYSASLTGVLVDLMKSHRNTGEAKGDSFESIEDLAGSVFDDRLYGDNTRNRLVGLDGNDKLFGRAGRDTLEGGNGRDFLNGGVGNDILIGGADRDVFVFSRGHDIIKDFDNDRLRLNDKLWGNANLTKAQVLDFASVVGDDTVFHFGKGNSLTLEDYTDIAALEAAIGVI
ncbi:MAG: hypothetical protein GJ676_04070 [Rhodobacteraceae bacterium]|nr:hypothetical protein [Paracoccaceae bacterium]